MPIRTSIFTGKKEDTEKFWRFTVQKGQLVFDGKKKNPGRGGYMEKDMNLISKLPKMKGKIAYVLKAKDLTIDVEALRKVLHSVA